MSRRFPNQGEPPRDVSMDTGGGNRTNEPVSLDYVDFVEDPVVGSYSHIEIAVREAREADSKANERERNLDFLARFFDIVSEHVSAGIKRAREIFKNDKDYEEFYSRLGDFAQTDCLADELMEYADYRLVLNKLFGHFLCVSAACAEKGRQKRPAPPPEPRARPDPPLFNSPPRPGRLGENEPRERASLTETPPALAAARLEEIKAYLSHGDMEHTADWSEKFMEIRDELFRLDGERRNQPWLGELDVCLSMLVAHDMFEQHNYGQKELILDFPNVFPETSTRLPPIPGAPIIDFASGAKAAPSLSQARDGHMRKHPKPVHDAQYGISEDFLKDYVAAHYSDARDYWEGDHFGPHRQRAAEYEDEEDQRFNMLATENAMFDECILEGMQETLETIRDIGPFKSGPGDIRSGGEHNPHVESLKRFSHFRGARRAGLQQCLNMFDNVENRITITPWRCLTFQDLDEPAEQPSISWTVEPVDDVPPGEGRDPFAYTRAHKWYVDTNREWAEWEREHAIKRTYVLNKSMMRDAPPMKLPESLDGPHYPHYLDKDMLETHTFLGLHRQLYERLLLASKRAPRPILTEMLECVKMGLRDEGWETLDVEFKPWEFKPSGLLAPIREDERAWLEFLGGPSTNNDMLRAEGQPPSKDPLFRAFEERVQLLLDDVHSEALFRDMKIVTMKEFIMEVNRCVKGPVKRHKFTAKQASKYTQELVSKGKLSFGYDTANVSAVGRGTMTMHPEDRIRWPAYDYQSYNEEMEDSFMAYSRISENPDMVDLVSEAGSESTQATVPPDDKISKFPPGMPNPISDTHPYTLNQDEAPVDPKAKDKTAHFMKGLGYRLGMTLRGLNRRHKLDRTRLSEEQKEANKEFLHKATKTWREGARTRPSDPKINKALIHTDGNHVVTPRYRDVVRMAEPEAYPNNVDEQDEGPADYWKGHKEALVRVREGLLREVYENRSRLLPTWSVVAHDASLPGTHEEKAREPIWSFAHPDRRTRTRDRFFDMNRWPVHLQTPEAQARIQASGPGRPKTHQTPRQSLDTPEAALPLLVTPRLARRGSGSVRHEAGQRMPAGPDGSPTTDVSVSTEFPPPPEREFPVPEGLEVPVDTEQDGGEAARLRKEREERSKSQWQPKYDPDSPWGSPYGRRRRWHARKKAREAAEAEEEARAEAEEEAEAVRQGRKRPASQLSRGAEGAEVPKETRKERYLRMEQMAKERRAKERRERGTRVALTMDPPEEPKDA